MTSIKTDTEKHVVTYGNHAFVAGGLSLFDVVGTKNKRLAYNVLPGQLVAYKKLNGEYKTVNIAALSAADLHSLYIGVGYSGDGSGLTTDIRHLGIEDISGCMPREVSTSSPKCGAPQVLDFYFDCTKCDETYSLEVTVDDNFSRSFGKWNASAEQFVGSIVTDCSSCDECGAEHNCREVACKLADALNNEFDLKIGSRSYPDYKKSGIKRPFHATRIHNRSILYCLTSASASDCESCSHVSGIKGALVKDTVYTFTGTLNNADPQVTPIGMIQNAIEQINDAFVTEYGENAHAGSAYFTGSFSDCCPFQIHVNTCDANFKLIDINDNEIAPKTDVNPFTTYGAKTANTGCIDCADAAVAAKGTLTFTGNALDTETVTIGAKTYTFEDTLTNVNGNVKIGATVNDTINNLVAAINLGSGAGTKYATAMTLHPTVSAVNGAGNTVVVTAKTAGTAGNALASTETLTNGSFGGATLAGGEAAEAASPEYYSCGVRVIAERVFGDCSCYLNKPLNFYARKLTLNPIGEGFRGKEWSVVEVQAMEMPAGFGSQIQWLEYQNEPIGRGRNYSRGNSNKGMFNLPDKKSRVNSVTAKCEDHYCSYYIQFDMENRRVVDRGILTINANMHIPSDDATTIASWETFQENLLALNPGCKVLTAVECNTVFGSCS
jgi:hypothetical protein